MSYKKDFMNDVEEVLGLFRKYAGPIYGMDAADKYIERLRGYLETETRHLVRERESHKEPLTRERYNEVKDVLSKGEMMQIYRTSLSQIAAYRTWDRVHSKKKKNRK